MYFFKNLYVGPSIQDPEKVKRKLLRGEGQFTIYVIAISPSIPGPGSNQLEILHCAYLKQPYYKAHPPFIIGIAAGRSEAVEMVRNLVQEAYDHTGSADVRAYLFPHGVRILRPASDLLTVSDSPAQPADTEALPERGDSAEPALTE